MRVVQFLGLAISVILFGTCLRQPATPLLLAPRSNEYVHPPVVLAWSATPDAYDYWLQVDSSPNFVSPVIDVRQSDTTWTIAGLAREKYRWRVAAMGPFDTAGAFSETDSFRVARADYPRTQVKMVRLGPQPNSLALTPDGREVWVNSSDTSDRGIYVVATDSLLVSHRVDAHGFDQAELKISPDGHYAYCCAHFGVFMDESLAAIEEFRTADYTHFGVTGYADMNGMNRGPVGYGLACTPSGEFIAAADRSGVAGDAVYTFNVPVEYGAEDKFNYVTAPLDLEYDRLRARLLVTNETGSLEEFDASTLNRLRSINLSGHPRLITLSPDDRYAYISQLNPAGLSIVDIAAWTTCSTLVLTDSRQFHPQPFSIALSPDGRFVFMGEENDNLVHVADVSDPFHPRLLETFACGSGRIRGIAFSSDGMRAYVSVNPDGLVVLER